MQSGELCVNILTAKKAYRQNKWAGKINAGLMELMVGDKKY